MSREIDRQIAELMGIDVERYNGIYLTNGARFSEDWSAMKLLVEWLQGKGMRVELWSSFGVYCAVAAIHYEGRKIAEIAEDASIPLALCTAVLSLPSEVLQDA